MMDPVSEFLRRTRSEWWPLFYLPRGYPEDSLDTAKPVSERDAADFLRAVDFVPVNARGEFVLPRSRAKEVIFWDGKTSGPSRRVPLWIEPIITIGAVARLHLDYGWPFECLGMQSVKWEFDVTAFLPSEFENEYIAVEVKATSKDLDRFLDGLLKCCGRGEHDCAEEKPPQRNAHKKWSGLMRSRAKLFWALGPGGDSRVFEMDYQSDGRITLTSTSDDQLKMPN